MKKYIIIAFISLLTITTFIKIITEPIHPHQEIAAAQKAPVFIFDLNGVLFDTDTMTVLRQLGIKDALWYLARYRSPRMLKIRFYETLHRITQTRTNIHNIKDPDGTIMPQLMLEWLQGVHANKILLQRTIDAIKNNPQWFLNATEQRLMMGMARAIFDPEQFVASRKLLDDLVPLIIHLKKEHGAKLYVLSNWDKESFGLLKSRFAHVFNWFDGCIISGEVGHVKPQREIYAHTHILHKNHAPHICFLDDQLENLNASKHFGWHTIQVNKTPSYFGFLSNIDSDIITKGVLTFLETKPVEIIPSVLKKAELSLPKEVYATE